MYGETPNMKIFREKLRELSRDELLEIIKEQDVDYIWQINRIEGVFRQKLRHLTGQNGQPIKGRKFTKEELILLIDPPFIYDRELAKLGFDEEQQRQIHIGSDPVLWAKHFLEDKPRAYQTLVLRESNSQKVMRFGRRLGKTATMAFYCLWYAYTTNNGRVIVVAPMKTHVGLIYDEIIKMAKQNDLILPVEEKAGMITRHVQSPQYQIDFRNGSTIKFFTTGMKSNSKADVARGQEADIIVLDEMDYMGPEDTDALMGMVQNTDEKKKHLKKQIMGASTPTGQRNKFYEWCVNPKEQFTEFWYPSYCNPLWDEEMEEKMHRLYPNPQVYRHEIEADWGEDTEGVYPHKFLKLAFQKDNDWKYVATRNSARSDFVIGVDWDKYGAGVNIVVLELCHKDYEIAEWQNKIRLVWREEIEKNEFTYLNAVDRLIDLNRIFAPKHIYVDRGAGEVQVEMLHRYGKENPESKLHKTVKGWQFSETIEVRDPWSKMLVKKDLKPFMVDNLYKMLEDERILFPADDEQLNLQLLSYIVERVSANGKPVFKAGGNTVDHAHDALILACFAIADNFDDLLNPSFATTSKTIKNEVFLPTFELTNDEDRDIAEETWGKGKGPVSVSRPMAYNVRRNKGSTGLMARKMF